MRDRDDLQFFSDLAIHDRVGELGQQNPTRTVPQRPPVGCLEDRLKPASNVSDERAAKPLFARFVLLRCSSGAGWNLNVLAPTEASLAAFEYCFAWQGLYPT